MQRIVATVTAVSKAYLKSAWFTVKANRRRIFEFSLLGMFVALAVPHPALADWSQLTTQIQNFKGAIVTACASLIVIGLAATGVGWMTRSQEGLGPVFWGGVTMVAAGTIILMGDAFVTTLQGG